jgi:hypothetical protein
MHPRVDLNEIISFFLGERLLWEYVNLQAASLRLWGRGDASTAHIAAPSLTRVASAGKKNSPTAFVDVGCMGRLEAACPRRGGGHVPAVLKTFLIVETSATQNIYICQPPDISRAGQFFEGISSSILHQGVFKFSFPMMD